MVHCDRQYVRFQVEGQSLACPCTSRLPQLSRGKALLAMHGQAPTGQHIYAYVLRRIQAHRRVVYEHVNAAHCVVAAGEGLQILRLKSGSRLLPAALRLALLPIPPGRLVSLHASSINHQSSVIAMLLPADARHFVLPGFAA